MRASVCVSTIRACSGVERERWQPPCNGEDNKAMKNMFKCEVSSESASE